MCQKRLWLNKLPHLHLTNGLSKEEDIWLEEWMTILYRWSSICIQNECTVVPHNILFVKRQVCGPRYNNKIRYQFSYYKDHYSLLPSYTTSCRSMELASCERARSVSDAATNHFYKSSVFIWWHFRWQGYQPVTGTAITTHDWLKETNKKILPLPPHLNSRPVRHIG